MEESLELLLPEQLEEILILLKDGADVEMKSATGLKDDDADIETQSTTEETLEMESEPLQSLEKF